MDGHLKYGLLMGLYSSALLAMPITVLANTDTQNATDLPQIVSWDDGHGYLESGEMLRNGWGYDTVNPAGKYVLFDEEGAILRRSESMEAELEDNYTGTEQVPAVIAFRARVFDGFAGTIEVVLEEQNGVTQTVFLMRTTSMSGICPLDYRRGSRRGSTPDLPHGVGEQRPV